MTEPTSLASWTRALRKQLDALGLDSAALCIEAGLDPQQMEDPNARYPLSATTRLWELAVQASGDPAIGLRVSRFVSPTTFHALGYALVASGSLREVFERIVRYHQVVSDALKLELSRDGERYLSACCNPKAAPHRHWKPSMRSRRSMCAPAAIAWAVTTRPWPCICGAPEPADPKPLHTVFRAPVFFGADEDCLEFAAQDFDSHLDDADPELAERNETVLKRTLAQLQPLTWERKVRATIEAQLPDGEPSAERIAQALHFSCAACSGTWQMKVVGLMRCSTSADRTWRCSICGTRSAHWRDQPFVGFCRYQQF